MTKEQEKHMDTNIDIFEAEYCNKYKNGQKEHGGNMWTMGAYQALNNMKDEVLDQWSYVMQIEKCLDEMRELTADMADGFYKEDVERILNRVKADK